MNHLSAIKKWMLLTCSLTFLYTPYSYAKTEQDIKAAYLFNFLKFINWPNDDIESGHRLCVLGKDSLNDKLKLLNQRSIRGKQLEVIAISDSKHTDVCSILFIGVSEAKLLENIFSSAHTNATLTISSIENFAELGGVIGFVKLGNVVRFEINLKQADQMQLSISSKLLELANKVVK